MMKLAKVIHRDDIPWHLSDGSWINPPVGTVVQVERKAHGIISLYSVYFPSIQSPYIVIEFVFGLYFEFL